MPHGSPIFVRVAAGGVLSPYYEGHFHALAGGGVSAVEIEARNRKAGEVVAGGYYPDYLTFKRTNIRRAGQPVVPNVPIAEIWAETPDPVEPAGAPLNINRLMVGTQNTNGVQRVERLLLDQNNDSDFLPSKPVTITSYANFWQAFPGYSMTAWKLGRLVFVSGLMNRPVGAPAWAGGDAFALPWPNAANPYHSIDGTWWHGNSSTATPAYCYCPFNGQWVNIGATGFATGNNEFMIFDFFYPTNA